MTPMLIMATLNHINTDLVEVMLFHLSTSWESVPNCKTAEDNFDEAVDCNTHSNAIPHYCILELAELPHA